MTTPRPILIAGGGPVGVIAALALARQGLPVHVFEAETGSTTCRAPRPRMLRRSKCWPDSAWSTRSSSAASRAAVSHLGPAEPADDRRIRFRHAQGRDALSVLRAMRAAQARRRWRSSGCKKFPHAKVEFSARVTALSQTGDGVEIEVETADGTRKVAGELSDRLRRRSIDGTQGAGHRVRWLHPSRAVHDPDHDLRPRHHVSGLHAQLCLRSGRLVLGVQGQRRRATARCGACCPRPSPSRPMRN